VLGWPDGVTHRTHARTHTECIERSVVSANNSAAQAHEEPECAQPNTRSRSRRKKNECRPAPLKGMHKGGSSCGVAVHKGGSSCGVAVHKGGSSCGVAMHKGGSSCGVAMQPQRSLSSGRLTFISESFESTDCATVSISPGIARTPSKISRFTTCAASNSA
jgi:hypothetical protein